MAEEESVYLWSTTALTNASADPAVNFAENQLPGTLNNSNRAAMAALARYVKDTDGSLTTAGSANAYTLTINGRQTPLATGHILVFKASFFITGAATLAVTNADAVALGTKAIRGPGDAALTAGQMISGGVYICRYDTAANGAAGAWLLLNPTPPSGTATNVLGADVLLNNTANYFDGPSMAQGTSGTWFVSGTVTVTDTSGTAVTWCKLWDGTTVIASGSVTINAATNSAVVTLSGYISSPAANVRISCRNPNTANGKILFNNTGNSKDSSIFGIRIA